MVDARFRRQGVGRALLEAAVEWAPEHGVAKLELHVFPWNEAAIALYESFGFEREGFRKRHYLRAGRLRRRDPHGAGGLNALGTRESIYRFQSLIARKTDLDDETDRND